MSSGQAVARLERHPAQARLAPLADPGRPRLRARTKALPRLKGKATNSVTVLSLPFESGCGGDEYPDCATHAPNNFEETLLLSTPVSGCITNVWGATLASPVPGETTEVQGGGLTSYLINNIGTPHVNIGDC